MQRVSKNTESGTHSPRLPSTPVSFLLSGLLVWVGASGCSSKAAADSAASAAPSGAESTGSAAPPVVVPKDGDATVVASLRKMASCERDEGFLKANCEGEGAWDEFRKSYVEADDLKLSKTSKLVNACFSLIDDENDNVREASTRCVAEYGDALTDKRSAIMAMIGRLETDKSEGVRSAMLHALNVLDPVKQGGAVEILALAKKMAPREDTSTVVRDLMDALTPDQGAGEPSADTVLYAIELTKDSNATHRASGANVLGSTKSRSTEACAALLTLIQTKKYPWHDGLRAMATLEGACKAHYDDVVTVLLAKMAEEDGHDRGFSGVASNYLRQMLRNPGFTPEQKAKLLGPAEKLHTAETNEHAKNELRALVEELKKP